MNAGPPPERAGLFCGGCGRATHPEAQFCGACGRSIAHATGQPGPHADDRMPFLAAVEAPTRTERRAGLPETPIGGGDDVTRLFCGKCGAATREGAVFCGACGAATAAGAAALDEPSAAATTATHPDPAPAAAIVEAPAHPGSPPPTARPAEGGGRGTSRPWLIGGAVALAVGAVVAAVLLVMGGGGSGDDASARPAPGPGASGGTYAAAAAGSVGELSDSARAVGSALGYAALPRDLRRVAGVADRQIAVVDGTIADLSGIPATNDADVGVRDGLIAAAEAHRGYLIALAGLAVVSSAGSEDVVAELRRSAGSVAAAYRAISAQAGPAADGIASAGLTDLSGVRAAIAVAGRQRGSGGSAYERPIVDSVRGADLGGAVRLTARYCDRTPGRVNVFVYRFELMNRGRVVAGDSYRASQTRACNAIGLDLPAGVPPGDYELAASVENLTNGVRGSRSGVIRVGG